MRIPLFVAAIVASDQFAKYMAVTRLKPRGSIPVIRGFFNLTYVENPGAAWGILAGQRSFLIAFSFATLIFLVAQRRKLFDHLACATLVQTLLFGGVIGNLIDRIRIGRVIDFFDFYWGRWHFPAFNLADAAICCGVFLFIFLQWRYDRLHAARPDDEPPAANA